MDLSIEAIALEPKWQGLFTPEEIDEATATLSEHGLAPALEAPSALDKSVLAPIEHQSSLAQLRIGSRRGLDLDSLSVQSLGASTSAQPGATPKWTAKDPPKFEDFPVSETWHGCGSRKFGTDW